MAKKKEHVEEQGETCPLWMISYSDLVTLMMSFFVILYAGAAGGSTTASDPEFAELVAALKAAFNHVEAPVEKVANPKDDFKELVQKLMALQTPQVKQTQPEGSRGEADSKGMKGKHFRVTRIREGLELVMGGPVFFEAFSARPTEKGEQQLKEIVQILRGHRNVIEVRGHVGETPWPIDWTYDDVMKLAYDRADCVGRVLRREGIDPRAIRLVAVGPNEPLKNDNLSPETAGASRRVEILVRESLVDDFATQKPARRSGSQANASAPAADPWQIDGPFAN
jgi:chemotaxis protein MotB